MPLKAVYRRVLLKLSGEALMGNRDYGLEQETVDRIAREVQAVNQMGVEVCMVIGGGNIFRGVAGASQGMQRATADYMGMLATVMNALAFQSALEAVKAPAWVMENTRMGILFSRASEIAAASITLRSRASTSR